jgi:hypothetical protein
MGLSSDAIVRILGGIATAVMNFRFRTDYSVRYSILNKNF